MVGFGSSLRMARRPGWECAYLDYEMLKLLLSQIEAVYEEEGQRQHADIGGSMFDSYDQQQKGAPGAKRKRTSRGDYRDELFLESDSDAAYLSLGGGPDEEYDFDYSNPPFRASVEDLNSGDNNSFYGGSDSLREQQPQPQQQQQQQPLVGPSPARPPPFTFHYSRQSSSSEEEAGEDPGCGTGYLLSSWKTTADKSNHPSGTHNNNSSNKAQRGVMGSTKKKWRNKGTAVAATTDTVDEYSEFFGVVATNHHHHRSGSNNNAFILEGSADVNSNHRPSQPVHGPSILSAPVRHTTGATGSLVPAPTTPNSSLFSFATSAITPPSHYNPHHHSSTRDEKETLYHQAALSVPRLGPSSHHHHHISNKKKRSVMKLGHERKQERRMRRLKRQELKTKRERLQRKVPLHIRVAHAKARAITERFLGFLRAETEKVMLFAQSRLGELADTAGSLRFPSYDDEYHGSARSAERRTAHQHYDYPLSDGGMHPSASSSSDEGATGGGQRMYPWSDSSDDEGGDDTTKESMRGTSSSISKVLSGAVVAFSEDSMGRKHSSTNNKHSFHQDMQSNKSWSTKASNRRDLDGIAVVRRQMKHCTTVRQNRGTFQRSDQILGEDMLFMSAVEEADGYTAVAVELMHVLRYICVNLIALRKICRKHDRLLVNRMLGGYYHRSKAMESSSSAADAKYTSFDNTETLGGRVAHVSGDVYETHPALLGQMNHYKLTGVYDLKIQKLANSRTVHVVSSCLALALSEYEMSNSRADAITKLNSKTSVTPKRSGGLPANRLADDYTETRFDKADRLDGLSDDSSHLSTASKISLTRLQFAVTSIFALREAAREKQNLFTAYLARSCLSFFGHGVIGEGLDGCSRETLDFLVSFDPDAALLLETNVLYTGLKQGHWKECPMRDLMISVIATNMTTPEKVSQTVASQMLSSEEGLLAYAFNVDPNVGRFKLLQHGNQSTNLPRNELASIVVAPGYPTAILQMSRTTCFLYMMNYFVVHATSNAFVKSTGASTVYTAIIIGAPNVSSIVVTIFHCFVLSRKSSSHNIKRNFGAFRWLFILSSLYGVVGNAMHGWAMDTGSIPMAVIGRLIIGLSSAEILQRQSLTLCLPTYIVPASARLTFAHVSGVVTGLLVGAFVDAMQNTMEKFGVRSLQSTSWLLMVCWMFHFLRLFVQFKSAAMERSTSTDDFGTAENSAGGIVDALNEDSEASSSASDSRNPSMVFRPDEMGDSHVNLASTYGSVPNENSVEQEELASASASSVRGGEAAPLRRNTTSEKGPKKRGFRQFRVFASRIQKLLNYKVGIPVSFFILIFATFSTEVFFTGTPIITQRYFGWSGAHACLFLGTLALSIVPIHFFCERIARRYEERTVARRSIQFMIFGLFVMFNWTSALSLASHVPTLLTDTDEGRFFYPYDSNFGVIQYVCGLALTFVSLTALEGSTLSLLSKVSPPHLRSIVINVGTISTVLTMVARLTADMQILMVGLSHKLINTDIVNALVVPLFLISFLVAFLIRRNYFFLL